MLRSVSIIIDVLLDKPFISGYKDSLLAVFNQDFF